MGETPLRTLIQPLRIPLPGPAPRPRPAAGTARAAVGYAPRRRLVDGNFDLALRSGERIALLGRNGSGKTTLLRSLCGELPLLAASASTARAAASPTSTSSRSIRWTSTPAPSSTCSV
jgi:ATP-binding cassette subfamily F protein 3